MMRVAIILLSLLAAAYSHSQTPDEGQAPLPARRIALTFDDAPRGDGPRFSGAERTGTLVEALAAAKSGAVAFFVTTKGFDEPGGRERIERYAAAGHLIANHSHSHRWLTRTELEDYIADIDEAERRLNGIANRRPWFRFPFLDEGTPLEKRNAVRKALAARGLRNGYVTIDNYDWYLEVKWKRAVQEGQSVDMDALRRAYVRMLTGAIEFYDILAVETLGHSPAHVLLLHENDLAVLFIGDLIAALRDDGWTIVSPDEAYDDPLALIEPQTLMTRQGHIAALAVEGGRSPRTLTHLAIEEKQIDALLDELGVFGDPSRCDTPSPC